MVKAKNPNTCERYKGKSHTPIVLESEQNSRVRFNDNFKFLFHIDLFDSICILKYKKFLNCVHENTIFTNDQYNAIK